MYEVISIKEYGATRFIKLKNMDTGTVDECFDDSALTNGKSFNFIQTGQQYDCKIKLFGRAVPENQTDSINCRLTNKKILIGKEEMTEVEVNNNKYYIVTKKVIGYLHCDNFNFCFTRKDLVQVNNTIHADLL